MKRLIYRGKDAAITVNDKSFITDLNKVVFLKKHMTPLKKEHWQIQLCLPYNALEKKETMKGKKTHY